MLINSKKYNKGIEMPSSIYRHLGNDDLIRIWVMVIHMKLKNIRKIDKEENIICIKEYMLK